jgi:hypothetical protein
MATDRVILKCLGNFQNPDHIFLNGHTADGTLGLAPFTDPSHSGTSWSILIQPDISIDLLVAPSYQSGEITVASGSGAHFSHGGRIQLALLGRLYE